MGSRMPAVALVLAPLFWAGNFIAGRYLSHSVSPLLLNGMRWAISALLFLAIVRAQGARLPLGTQWRRFLWLGLTGVFGFSALLYIGLSLLPASLAGAISGLQPVAILLMDVIINRVKPAPRAWFGVAISFCGVLFITGSGLSVGRLDPLGAGAILSAGVLWGIYTALGRRYALDPLVATAGAAVYGAVPSVGAAALVLPSAHLHMAPAAMLAVLYVGSVASVGAYYLWNIGVQGLGAARAASFINLLPVFSVALGVLILGESLTLYETIGTLVVVAGAWLAGTRSVGRRPASSAVDAAP